MQPVEPERGEHGPDEEVENEEHVAYDRREGLKRAVHGALDVRRGGRDVKCRPRACGARFGRRLTLPATLGYLRAAWRDEAPSKGEAGWLERF